MSITLNFQPIDKIRKQVRSKLWLGVVIATSLTVPTLANAEITQRDIENYGTCLLYTSPSPRDGLLSRMPSSA